MSFWKSLPVLLTLLAAPLAAWAGNPVENSYGVTGSTSGTVTIQSSTGTYNFNLPASAGTSGYALVSGGGGSAPMTWAPASGSVTSVGLNLPSMFTISGSPVTTSGTLAATLATQTANAIFAGPTTGSAAAPTFRALVSADLPAGLGTITGVTAGTGLSGGGTSGGVTINLVTPVAVANGGTGLTSGTSGGVLGYTASGTLASSGVLTANAPLIGGGAGALPTSGTVSGNTTTFGTTTGTLTSGHCVQIDANGNLIDAGSACGTGSGSLTALTGDVTATGTGSVAATVHSVGGVAFATSATTDTTNASNISSGTLANARLASLTANSVLGALTATTPSGLSLPSCSDTSGNHLNYVSGTGFSCGTSSGSGGGGAISGLTAATATNTVASGNYQQNWNWALSSSSGYGLNIGETTASTGGGVGTQYLVNIGTLSNSTAGPLSVYAGGSQVFTISPVGATTVALPTVATGTGNSVSVTAGNSSSGNGGGVTLSGGSSTASTSSGTGPILIQGGTGYSIGGGVTIQGGTYTGSGASGGPVTIQGGGSGSVNGSSGGVTIKTQNGNGNSYGPGTIALLGGNASGSATGGPITITGGNNTASGVAYNQPGGSVTLTGGNGGYQNSNGGDVIIAAGTKQGTGRQGALVVNTTTIHTPTTLSIATSTFTPNGTADNYNITLVHASCPCTLANPSVTPVAGQRGVIVINQSATGSDLINTWGTYYKFSGGTKPTLSTGVSAQDLLSYYVVDATHIDITGFTANLQ